MKWFGGVVLVLIVIAVLSYVFVSSGSTTPEPTPTPTLAVATPTEEVIATPTPLPTGTTVSCTPENLKGTIATEGAAGNIYGMLSLKNVSSNTCTIPAGEKIAAGFDTSVKNLKVEQVSPEGSADDSFTLASGGSVYSQIHYPNGPQCSGSTTSTPVTLSYELSAGKKVLFLPDTGKPFSVTTCTESNDSTTLQIWPLSEKPITQ